MPKEIRLEFFKFDGSNSTGWVFKAIQFFDYYQKLDHQKLTMTSYHMEGEALVWYQVSLKLGQFLAWESFIKALHTWFGPSTYDDPMEVLMRLKQTSSVSNYKA